MGADTAPAEAHRLPAWIQARLQNLGQPRWLLLGEQHDAAQHQQLHAAVVTALAAQGTLAAIVLEMAERGTQTTHLGPDATEADTRAALRWNTRGWPWERYGALVMAGVRAGVPVVGGNLPRQQHAAVMHDPRWDDRLPPDQHRALLRAIDEGHCHQLPANQWPAMARIQIARDDAMAATLLAWQHPTRTVLLLTGAQHARRDRGVPLHLARLLGRPLPAPQLISVELRASHDATPDPAYDALWLTDPVPPVDHCAALRS